MLYHKNLTYNEEREKTDDVYDGEMDGELKRIDDGSQDVINSVEFLICKTLF